MLLLRPTSVPPYLLLTMQFAEVKQHYFYRSRYHTPCPVCQQSVSALHIFSGCQHNIISGMITGHHNVACRLIIKAISKGSFAGCIVHMDAGSTDCFAQQNLQIPVHASSRTLPEGVNGANVLKCDFLVQIMFECFN